MWICPNFKLNFIYIIVNREYNYNYNAQFEQQIIRKLIQIIEILLQVNVEKKIVQVCNNFVIQ